MAEAPEEEGAILLVDSRSKNHDETFVDDDKSFLPRFSIGAGGGRAVAAKGQTRRKRSMVETPNSFQYLPPPAFDESTVTESTFCFGKSRDEHRDELARVKREWLLETEVLKYETQLEINELREEVQTVRAQSKAAVAESQALRNSLSALLVKTNDISQQLEVRDKLLRESMILILGLLQEKIGLSEKIRPPLVTDDGLIPSDFRCAICFASLPLDPVVTDPCQHCFCRECLAESMKRSNRCPLDRIAISEEQIMPLQGLVRRVFDEVAVKCPYEGCSWTGQMGHYEQHAIRCKADIVQQLIAQIDRLNDMVVARDKNVVDIAPDQMPTPMTAAVATPSPHPSSPARSPPSTPSNLHDDAPESPAYSPPSPAYSPLSPAYSPTPSPEVNSPQPGLSNMHGHDQAAEAAESPVYVPSSPAYSPTNPAYPPLSPPYSPPTFEIEDAAAELNLPLAMLTMSAIARGESSAVQALFGDDSDISDDEAVV